MNNAGTQDDQSVTFDYLLHQGIIILMRELEWGRIARQHDELVRQEQQRKRERENYHKILYKQDLQAMMAEKIQQQRTLALSERKHDAGSHRSLDYDRIQEQKRAKLQLMIKESSDYNYRSVHSRKRRMRSELQEDLTFHKEKYRKAETERSQETQMEGMERVRKRKELAQVYQQQMDLLKSRRRLERLEDRRLQKLAHQVESRREIERQEHINRIKYGYSQNPEAYQTICKIYNQKEEVTKAFLRKLEIEKSPTQESVISKKTLQTIEASNYNKNYSMLKEQHKKEQITKETYEESKKLSKIQQQLRAEMQQKKMLQESQKRQLKEELERQMKEAANHRLGSLRMSEEERRLNQPLRGSLHPISIPGLARDYRDIKKDEIIDRFLNNKSTHYPFS